MTSKGFIVFSSWFFLAIIKLTKKKISILINIKYYSKIKSDRCVRCMHKNIGFARALQGARVASSNDQMSAFRNDV
jgi:hypothetical protein